MTFDGEEEDEISLAALAAIRELLEPYDYYIDSAVGNSQADSLASEMGTILAVAAVIIVLVLLLTSRSYAEIPVLLITFIAAALLNLGTNFIFGEISFVSNSVTVVLQLALGHRLRHHHAPPLSGGAGVRRGPGGLHRSGERRHSLYLCQQPYHHFGSGRYDVHAVPDRL